MRSLFFPITLSLTSCTILGPPPPSPSSSLPQPLSSSPAYSPSSDTPPSLSEIHQRE